MDSKRARRALRKVARREGKTEREVVSAIETAIAEAIGKAYKEGNREAIARWEEIPCAGNVPTAYELLTYLGERVEKECNMDCNYRS